MHGNCLSVPQDVKIRCRHVAEHTAGLPGAGDLLFER
jgi:CubicO group peptidase (beta-lactamase class C family)